MADLKPLGSEKLQGKEKINRILEIANYGRPEKIVEDDKLSTTTYTIQLADGNYYGIIKEKLGYIIKRGINESELDYIDPIKNRRYHKSYSQAMKKINLIAGELNRLYENDEGINLIGEKKKFVLKTPEPPAPEPSYDEPTPDLGGDEELDLGLDADTEGGDEFDLGLDADTEGGDVMPDAENEDTFKSIQKLTGKLGQKLRTYDNNVGLTSEDIKYVLNSVISAVDLDELSEEDKEDILSNFEEDEDDYGVEDTTELDIDAAQQDFEDNSLDVGNEELAESKAEKVISKYFTITEDEKKVINENRIRNYIREKVKHSDIRKEVKRLSETVEQELASSFLIKENDDIKFLGKTNLKNLVFEFGDKKVRVSPEGELL